MQIDVCEGTYAEAVTITTSAKNGLHLEAAGDLHGFELSDVSGVVIEGFWVQHYANDIELEHADGNVLRENVTTAAFQHDGVERATTPTATAGTGFGPTSHRRATASSATT